MTSRKVEVEVEPINALHSLRLHTLAMLGTDPAAYINAKGYLVKDYTNVCGSVEELVFNETPSQHILATFKAPDQIYSVINRN